jgi:hypothetical protein
MGAAHRGLEISGSSGPGSRVGVKVVIPQVQPIRMGAAVRAPFISNPGAPSSAQCSSASAPRQGVADQPSGGRTPSQNQVNPLRYWLGVMPVPLWKARVKLA